MLEQDGDTIELVDLDRGQPSLQVFDALLRLHVRPEIFLGLMAVALGLSVLADHDERRGILTANFKLNRSAELSACSAYGPLLQLRDAR